MLKKSASGVPRLAEAASRGRSHRLEAQRTEAYASVSSLAAPGVDAGARRARLDELAKRARYRGWVRT
ncbi:hypothetical protein COMA2_20070 [Candidatus Nitrospira nitrificans]|uniref:Uncharacterized protein n=1 Tax=Candidatus Nitrospira nitrificans TaxID=1742973 RepID=A0A0S4LEH6_9BACT|nr:hypothetical protein COMA2_20070 [Candidatus Nitrospira nitrificans]